MLTVTAFSVSNKHSPNFDLSVRARPVVRSDGEISAAILEAIWSITDAHLLGLGAPKARPQLAQTRIHKVATFHL